MTNKYYELGVKLAVNWVKGLNRLANPGMESFFQSVAAPLGGGVAGAGLGAGIGALASDDAGKGALRGMAIGGLGGLGLGAGLFHGGQIGADIAHRITGASRKLESAVNRTAARARAGGKANVSPSKGLHADTIGALIGGGAGGLGLGAIGAQAGAELGRDEG